MAVRLPWVLGYLLIGLLVGIPALHFRSVYAHAKRFREVTPGRFYRCGQLTANGLEEAFLTYGIKTVINLQHENPDPNMDRGYYITHPKIRESELCAQYGVRYILLNIDLLPRPRVPAERPAVIDEYLQLLDDPAAYPILLHCKAGLHRTGLLTAVYRIEYEGWSVASATRELRANGFGDSACTIANDYLFEVLEHYQPGQRRFPANDLWYAAVGASVRARKW